MEKTITFSVSGNQITGTLHGSAQHWSFESETDFFKSNFGTNHIEKHSTVKPNAKYAKQNEIYSLVCCEAELPSF